MDAINGKRTQCANIEATIKDIRYISENGAKFVIKWLQGNKVYVLRLSPNPNRDPMGDLGAKLERCVRARQLDTITTVPSVRMIQHSEIPAAACGRTRKMFELDPENV